MDKRIYLLTIVAFIVGMVELIIGGILDLVAIDLDVTVGQAGLLISIFSVVFAIAGPLLLAATSNVERKKLTQWSLVVFFIGNVIAIIAPSYSVLMAARVIAAASGALLVVLCVTLASNIASEAYRGRAIGLVFMGISGSLVLGVPFGLMLGNAFGWRAPFILIAFLTIICIAGVYFFMEEFAPRPSIPIREQLKTLKQSKLFFAQLTSLLFLAGHLTLYGYLTPFLKTTLGLNGTWVSIVYLIFGVAAVMGGGIGGMLADRFGTKISIIGIISVFALTMFVIPYTTFSLPVFLVVMVIWSMLSWAVTPAQQSYLIESAPHSSDIQQSLNNSALHFGIAIGSFIGSVVIEQSAVEYNATIGAMFIVLALGAAVFSMTRGETETVAKEHIS
ncbi:MFS transporter [Pontibacillus salicampi]|uniref:MFS transporter n=1 Tax=Pontibacillus salicampi TaxID=1449801 RepID=A0ABV6LQV3_9BACI